MSLPCLHDAGAHCFFFDFDGTLAEIANTPGSVRMEQRARKALSTLRDATGGAVAVVTGREIGAVDRFLAPLELPVAGVHGLERRGANGAISRAAADSRAKHVVEAYLRPFVDGHPGLLLEDKPGSVALHYRSRPDLERPCLRLVEAALAPAGGGVLIRGKMVIDICFHRATKGTAIKDFLGEAPFKGRVPFFAGDDATDEDGFSAVNNFGGISVKVGPGETAAFARAASVDEFLTWLSRTAETLGTPAAP